MKITVKEVGGVTVIELDGRLAGDEGRRLARQVRKLLADGKTRFLVSVDRVSYVDSNGVGTLVRALTSAKAAGGDLRVIKPNERVQELLTLTNLGQILDVLESEEAGIASFG
jgi:anti-sigma B factor antagonist